MKKKTMITKLFIACMLAPMIAVTLAACGGGSSTGGEEPSDAETSSGDAVSTLGEDGKYHIRMANIAALSWSLEPLAIGIEKGFFEEENIVIEDQGPVDVFTQLALLESGSLDIINDMESDAIAAIDVGSNIIEIASSDIASKDQPHMAYVVTEDSPVRRGSDLVGATSGLSSANGCSLGFLYEFAAQDGVENPARDVAFVTAGEPALLESLRRGDVAVAGLHGNTNEAVLKNLYPDLRVLFTDYDILEDRGGNVGWYAAKDWVTEDPERTTAFVRAIAKTNNWINANPEEAGELYKTLAVVEVNDAIFAVRAYGKDGLINSKGIETWIEILSRPDSFQPLQNADLTFDDVATNAYNPYANETAQQQ
jgi:ABC-type nitrate/sulfonate/bicarbonate transport system substrate-binding protein